MMCAPTQLDLQVAARVEKDLMVARVGKVVVKRLVVAKLLVVVKLLMVCGTLKKKIVGPQFYFVIYWY